MAFWLFKTEPCEFSIDDLKQQSTTRWDGIRNYQARNFIRDDIKRDDLVFIYHSSCKIPAIAGIAKVIATAYPDPSQFDPTSPYFDAKSVLDNPKWLCVDIEYQSHLRPISLATIKNDSNLSDMYLVKKGTRLSVQPVSEQDWLYLNSES